MAQPVAHPSTAVDRPENIRWKSKGAHLSFLDGIFFLEWVTNASVFVYVKPLCPACRACADCRVFHCHHPFSWLNVIARGE